MTKQAWVTLATNDSYALGALVLVHSLRRVSSAYPSVILITPSVTDNMRGRLSAVFAEVVVVDVLDSRDAAHLALLARPELGVTFTKIHCWSLTQYDKCVFLDADTLVVQNCDELFEREELSAAPDVGWPDCFNSGVFVYSPSADTFGRLLEFAKERGSFDGGDQGLLNSYFSDWSRGDSSKRLPFLYNVTSAAFYSYLPALKQYGQDLKIIHFIGNAKPWLQNFNWESRSVDAPGHLEPTLQLWWDLFVAHVHPQLDTTMVEKESFQTHLAPHTSHYRIEVDAHSQFPWHRPEAQPTLENEQQKYIERCLAEFHDPWENYRGNVPPSGEQSEHEHAQVQVRVEIQQTVNVDWDSYAAPARTEHVWHDPQPYSHHEPTGHCDQHNRSFSPTAWEPSHHTHTQVPLDTPSYQLFHEAQPSPSYQNYHDAKPAASYQNFHEAQPSSSHQRFHHAQSTASQNTFHEPHSSTAAHVVKEEFNSTYSAPAEPTVEQHKVMCNGELNSSYESAESETECNEPEVRPRHPYDNYYLLHRSVMDRRGRKRCSHEPPSPPPTPPPPPPPPVLEGEETPQVDSEQAGLAGTMARLTVGAAAPQQALDEHTRRQGWEAGNIDYLGADSFANIWAKISATLSQAPASDPVAAPAPEAPPAEAPAPVSALAEAPAESAAPESVEAPAPAPADAQVDAPVPATETATAFAEAATPAHADAQPLAPIDESTPAAKSVTAVAEPPVAQTPVPEADSAPAPEADLAPVPAPAEAPAPVPADAPAPVPTDAPAPIPTDATVPIPADAPAPVPAAIPADAPTPVPADAPAPLPVDAPAPVPADAPAPVPTDAPAPVATEALALAPVSAETPAPTEAPGLVEAVEPILAPVEAVKVASIPPQEESVAAPVQPASEASPAQVQPPAEASKAEEASATAAHVAPTPAAAEPTETAACGATPPPAKGATLVSSSDSPPLVSTPVKDAVSPKSAEEDTQEGAPRAECRKAPPKDKLNCQLKPSAESVPLLTPDSELEDAAALAQSIIASELGAAAPAPPTPLVTSATPPVLPAAPALSRDSKQLSVDEPALPTPPVSLAQIGILSAETETQHERTQGAEEVKSASAKSSEKKLAKEASTPSLPTPPASLPAAVEPPMPEQKISPPEQKVSPSEQVSPAEQVSSPKQKVSPPEQKVSPPDQKVSSAEQKVSPPDQKVSSAEQKVSPVEQKVSPPAPAPEPKVSPPAPTAEPKISPPAPAPKKQAAKPKPSEQKQSGTEKAPVETESATTAATPAAVVPPATHIEAGGKVQKKEETSAEPKPDAPAEPRKKKVVKKVVKKESAESSDKSSGASEPASPVTPGAPGVAAGPVPPPRKKEKKPAEKK